MASFTPPMFGPLWWPLYVNTLNRREGGIRVCAFLRLPNGRFISWDMDTDYDERVVWEAGPLRITRPETAEECQDREEGEAEAAWERYELNRYVLWSY